MWIILLLAAAVFVYGAVTFNRCITYKTLLREATSGIEVQLKRRHDLIPNIVEAVKGYMRYEQALLERITSLRTQLMLGVQGQKRQQLESALSGALKNIFALSENYPELKASQGFLRLHDDLVNAEDQIQLARRYYNGTVRMYNILIQSFPSNLVALLFRFRQADFFEIEYATQARVPEVSF